MALMEAEFTKELLGGGGQGRGGLGVIGGDDEGLPSSPGGLTKEFPLLGKSFG